MAKRLAQRTQLLTVIWLAALLLLHSQAGTGVGTLFLVFFGGGFLFVTWLALFLLSEDVRSMHPLHGLLPFFLLVTGGLVYAFAQPPMNPLFRIRFAMSRPSLTAAATQQLRGQTQRPGSWIGLFPIKSATVNDGEVRFMTGSCGMVYSCGLVYAPDSSPWSVSEDRFFPLGHGWYHVHQGF